MRPHPTKARAIQHVEVYLDHTEEKRIAIGYLCEVFGIPNDAHIGRDGNTVCTYECFRGDVESVAFPNDRDRPTKRPPMKATPQIKAAIEVLNAMHAYKGRDDE